MAEERDTLETEKQLNTLELIDNKLKNQPDDIDLLFSKAMTLGDGGNLEEAVETLNQALEIAPEDKKLLYALEMVTSKLETPKDGVIEDAADEPEGTSPHPPDFDEEIDAIELKDSFTYLIPEERSSKTYQLLKKIINEGKSGFCITRTFPDKIRDRYRLGDTPILWLSNVSKEDAVRPKDLEKLSLSLEEFLSKQGGVVLLDGIEYLITNNNFITVLKLIQSLRDQVAINRSILLLSINPSTMDSHQINLLKREVDMVIE
jgi:tetratricopeptide (TPR) repeat protein